MSLRSFLIAWFFLLEQEPDQLFIGLIISVRDYVLIMPKRIFLWFFAPLSTCKCWQPCVQDCWSWWSCRRRVWSWAGVAVCALLNSRLGQNCPILYMKHFVLFFFILFFYVYTISYVLKIDYREKAKKLYYFLLLVV